MAGLVMGALGGLGEAAIGAGRQLGEHASRTSLAEQAAEIQKQRDAVLESFQMAREGRQEEATIRAEERKREPGRRAASAAEGLINSRLAGANQAGSEEAAMLAGSGAPISVQGKLSEREEALIRARELEKEDQYERAHSYRQDVRDQDRLGLQKEELSANTAHRRDTLAEQRRQHDEQARHNLATERNVAATNGRLNEVAKLQAEGLRFDLEGKKELRGLQSAYEKETDPAKRATMHANLYARLGKDRGLPEPVKLAIESINKELNNYADREKVGALKPQETARRTQLEQRLDGFINTGILGSPAATPGPAPEDIEGLRKRANNKMAVDYFEKLYGKGSAAQYLGK